MEEVTQLPIVLQTKIDYCLESETMAATKVGLFNS
jgi:hypothetical protein